MLIFYIFLLLFGLYLFYLAYIFWKMSDEECISYRKKLLYYLEDKKDEEYSIWEIEDGKIETIFRDKNGDIKVKRNISPGYSKVFFNNIKNR